jgi:hypothetical protein
VLAPLVRFVETSHHAPDLLASGVVKAMPRQRSTPRLVKKHGLRHDVGLVVHYLRTGGPRVLAGKVVSRLTRRR